MKIDAKDWKIIEVLRQNSRTPIREIAKQTMIRPSTVHQRMQKLIGNNVIEKFTIKLDNTAVGEGFIVFILVKGSTTDYIDNRILGNRHVKEIFGVTGEHDMLIKLKFDNISEFNEFILGFRKSKKEVQSTLTMIATAILKEEL